MKNTLSLIVNGQPHTVPVTVGRTLLEVIREDLGLTGTKNGCGMGECGTCTVLLDGKTVNACLVLAHEADGCEVTTIEGLSADGRLHPIQQAFVEEGAIQCGFCSPGMMMNAKGLLDSGFRLGADEIRSGLIGNLCRCTGYVKIVKAVQAAQERMAGGNDP